MAETGLRKKAHSIQLDESEGTVADQSRRHGPLWGSTSLDLAVSNLDTWELDGVKSEGLCPFVDWLLEMSDRTSPALSLLPSPPFLQAVLPSPVSYVPSPPMLHVAAWVVALTYMKSVLPTCDPSHQRFSGKGAAARLQI